VKPGRPLKGPRRKPGKVLFLSPTICPECGRSWSGAELLADADACPDCKRGDKVEGRAKFAPSKRGTLVPDTGTEVEE
jgi:predicted Zn-ribbon and HTH transcriptional regulator